MALTRITKGVIKPNENYDTHNINSTGIITAIGLDVNGNGDISGNLNVGGVLTYEDVTSIDSVGIITAQSDIHVGGGVSVVGVGTFSGLDINGDIDVDGHTNLDNASIAGVTTFYDTTESSSPTTGSVRLLGGLGVVKNIQTSGGLYATGTAGLNITHSADINGDLDVDGHTNLDNVSIAGISTFSGIVDAVNTPASIRVAQDIQHKGDANTKISFPANDEISLETSGHDRLYIKSNGFIGMGTVTPAVDIHNFSDGLNGNSLRLENREGYITIINDGNALHLDADSHFIRSKTGSTYVSVNSSGNLNINYDLDVDGHTNLDNVSVAGVVTATSFVGALPISNDGNGRIITATGSGGLDAESNLTWDGSVLSATGSDAQIRLYDSSGGTNSAFRLMAYNGINYIQSGQAFSSGSSADLVFSNMFGHTNLMRLTSGGRLNLGTSNAVNSQTTFKAQIETATNKLISFGASEGSTYNDYGAALIFSRPQDGAARICGIYQHTNQSLGIGVRDDFTISTGGNAFYYSATERFRIDSSGNVNFGAEKSVALPSGTGIQVYHSANPRIKLTNDTTGNGSTDGTQIYLSNDGDTIIDNKDSEDIIIHTNASEKLRITTHGNIEQNSTGSGISYFKGSSEYIFGSNTSSPSSGGMEANVQIHSYKTRAHFSINAYMNNAGGPISQFVSSRSGTPGTLGTKAVSNDYLGEIRFFGDNGTNGSTLAHGATIWARAKSTPSDGDTIIASEINFSLGNASAGTISDKMKIQGSDGKIKFGPNLVHQLHSQGFLMYPNNGSNNVTRLTFSGLVSGCYIAQIGYYNAAGSGYGGAMFFVSGYQTASYTYDLHEIRRWDNAGNSAISSASKYNSTWVIDVTNTHGSYTGGGEVSIYGDASSTCTISYV